MKTNTVFIIGFFICFTVISCIQNKEFDTPKGNCESTHITPNISIADLKKLATNSPQEIKDDFIIEGYVISDDEAGNFYHTIHFQDAIENPSQGLQLDVDLQDMYTTYQIGRKIYIKAKGLFIQNRKGTIKLGGIHEYRGYLSVGKLDAISAKKALFRTCESLAAITPKAVAIDKISDELINTLITIENIEVTPEHLDQSYAEEGKNTDITLRNCKGETIILRNSGYAQFQKEKLPTGNGRITAVLGKYNKNYQLTIRNTKDVDFNNPRCVDNGNGSGGGTQTSTEDAKVYFSEYAEGSSNNKYLEIYNDTGADIDLSNYSIKLYSNGNTEASSSLSFDENTILEDKSAYVVYHSSSDDQITSKGNISSSVARFNGDDAIELLKNDTVIDIIGKKGEDPGSGWSVAGVNNATKDHTLVRKSTIHKGNTNWEESSGTNNDNSEWVIKEKNDWSNIGTR